MTTVEEDLLLNDPVVNDFDDNLPVIDEDLLLGAGEITRKGASLDDSLLLEPETASEQAPEQVSEPKEEAQEESEHEELDYDEEEEDDDKRERTSRYTSEKKGGRNDSEDGADDSKKENGEAKKKSGIPSLFDKTITNNPSVKPGDQAIGVILRIEGEAERIFYPPPSFFIPQQPIVPRLPNGIPLLGMPINHGRAGFGAGYQQQQQQQRLGGGGGMAVQWDNEVARFLSARGNPGGHQRIERKDRKRRSRSYSSVSSSSESRSRSRSSSRSDRRRREKRRRDDRVERRDSDRRDSERRDSRRRDDRRRHEDRRSRERDSYVDRRRKEKNSAMESAKALGLSNDYIDQVNEQKRKREEIIRKKEERRHAPPPSTSKEVVKDTVKKEQTKAYLAVNVSGVQQLPTAVKKIEAMAMELGPIKKCWRSADDVVSIIFNAHDKAKDFMIKYNGKVMSGLRINVSLEKKFLNLSEIN